MYFFGGGPLPNGCWSISLLPGGVWEVSLFIIHTHLVHLDHFGHAEDVGNLFDDWTHFETVLRLFRFWAFGTRASELSS